MLRPHSSMVGTTTGSQNFSILNLNSLRKIGTITKDCLLCLLGQPSAICVHCATINVLQGIVLLRQAAFLEALKVFQVKLTFNLKWPRALETAFFFHFWLCSPAALLVFSPSHSNEHWQKALCGCISAFQGGKQNLSILLLKLEYF